MNRFYSVLLLMISLGMSSLAMTNEICEKLPTSNSTPTFRQCGEPEPGQLSIAVRNGPPFVYEELNKSTGVTQLKGIAIDLWENIADELNLDYQYVCLGLSETLTALSQGDIDIAISPLTITKDREKVFDFSHQYFSSGLVFASGPAETNFDFSKAFNTLSNAFQSDNLKYLLFIFLTLFTMLTLLAVKNIDSYQSMPLMKEKSKPTMVMHVMLYSLLNISGIRKDVFGFASIGMQAFSLLILIFGITVSASLFSMVTAALTQSVTPQANYSIDNIDQYRVSTLRGSTAQSFLCESSKQPHVLQLTDTWEQALNNVTEKRSTVVLGDWVQLVYLARNPQFQNKVTIHDQSFQFEPYGWGFKNNLDIRDQINQELMGMLRSQQGEGIIENYLGDQTLNMKSQ